MSLRAAPSFPVLEGCEEWPPIKKTQNPATVANKYNGDLSPTIRHNPIDGFQASLLIELQKLDWGPILDNKSDGNAR